MTTITQEEDSNKIIINTEIIKITLTITTNNLHNKTISNLLATIIITCKVVDMVDNTNNLLLINNNITNSLPLCNNRTTTNSNKDNYDYDK